MPQDDETAVPAPAYVGGDMLGKFRDLTRSRTQVLDEPVSTMRAKACEQKETIATYVTSLLMAVPLEARAERDLDLSLYAAMRARSRAKTSLAVMRVPETPLWTGITRRFSC